MTEELSSGINFSVKNTGLLTVGYFPTIIPRDPLYANNFLEHIILGQVIEPLVEVLPSGELAPAVATEWSVSSDGLSLCFTIAKDLLFSDGSAVTALDVKYSIQRHIDSDISQSRSYLKVIKAIQILDSYHLTMDLTEPYVAILKALSRDHLGIIPNGWVVDDHKDEPIVGTGPYRIVRGAEGWELKANSLYRDFKAIKIPGWRLIQGDPQNMDLSSLPVPDYMPFAQTDFIEMAKLKLDQSGLEYMKRPVQHYAQLSAWWNPNGKYLSDVNRQSRIMCALRELLQIRRCHLGLEQGASVIPVGISGHLLEVEDIIFDSAIDKSKAVVSEIALYEKDYSSVVCAADVAKIEAKHNVQFNFIGVPHTNFEKIKTLRPDVIICAYGGAFQDPEGFLMVLSYFLGSELKLIFGVAYEHYRAASVERSKERREKLYQTLCRTLLEKNIVAPGWKMGIYSYARPDIEQWRSSNRYTPKLIDFGISVSAKPNSV